MAFFALISVFLALITAAYTEDRTKGSTPNLKNIVVGRCEDYLQRSVHPTLKPKNCEDIWNKFHDAFAFKNACKLTEASYDVFFDAVEEGYIYNQGMFWSGTYRTAHSYSYFDVKFKTLEDTLAGFMMNDLRWCGNPSLPPNISDGIEYQSCPSCVTYNKVFWIQASTKFAQRVRGDARVMVNGTRSTGPAYSNTSIFGKYELPNLKVSHITRLLILVIHTIGKRPIERCGTKSIKQLKADAEARGLHAICENDPDMAKHVLCIDHPKSEECQFADEDPPEKPSWKTVAVTFAVLFAMMTIIVIFLLLFIYFRRKKNSSTRSP